MFIASQEGTVYTPAVYFPINASWNAISATTSKHTPGHTVLNQLYNAGKRLL